MQCNEVITQKYFDYVKQRMYFAQSQDSVKLISHGSSGIRQSSEMNLKNVLRIFIV